jgi:hypothetical protein
MTNQYLPGVITIPSALEITAITQSNPMVITTTMNITQSNSYIPGMAIVLTIPWIFGMWQAMGKIGTILSVSNNLISVNINSTNFDPFVVPSGGAQQASLAPYGSRNLQYENTTDKVPFQNLNNIGN